MSALSKVAKVAKREIWEIIPALIFFLVGFNLIDFSKMLILTEAGIAYEGIASACIGALLIAKAVLLADLLPIMNIFQGSPLYMSILFKSVVYTFFAALVRLAEILVRDWIHAGGLAAGAEKAVSEFVLAHFVFVVMWVFILLIFYVTLTQLRDEVLGGVPLAKILLSRDKKRLFEKIQRSQIEPDQNS